MEIKRLKFNCVTSKGILDGFLTPYKIIRVGIDKDLDGWRPEKGKLDKYGNEIEDREYNDLDYDKNLILEKRTELVAQKITDFLKNSSRYDKTIVFCENINHAERMRQALVNANPDIAATNNKYIMRITGDNEEGKAQLDNFINPEETFPVIATTSKLMTTGVDAQTCKVIVLDKRIASMTEFKQIIGRGTRINEDYNKLYFTIIDFRRATALFADADFDGEPVQVREDNENEEQDEEAEDSNDINNEVGNENGNNTDNGDDDTGERPRKYIVDDVEVFVIAERIQYLDSDGKLITETFKDYTRKTIRKNYSSLNAFLNAWKDADKKQTIIDELVSQGVFLDEIEAQIGHDYDAFDLICHIAFDKPPRTKKERANDVKKRNIFTQYEEKAKMVLMSLLDKYADSGLRSVETLEILKVEPFPTFGTPIEIVKLFGGKNNYFNAINELKANLYQEAA
ncbi:hypothetical protein CCP3SC5AM1_380002 [Gammaproteobacteria bacterium]